MGHIFGIGQGGTEGHDADGTFDLWRDVPHPGADDLQHGLNKYQDTLAWYKKRIQSNGYDQKNTKIYLPHSLHQ